MNDKLIRFRGVRLDTKDWAYGFVVRFQNDDSTFDYFIQEDTTKHQDNVRQTLHQIEPESVGQFVGVLRSNQQVYIGDIVRHGASTRIVEYRNGNTMLIRPDKSSTILLSFSQDAEILGNIFQHPDLLKTKP